VILQLISVTISHIFHICLHAANSGSFPRTLTAAEEREYLARYKETGDMDARSKLIEHNLRLVAHIIKKYYSATKDQDDLISIGTIGLIKGVSTFNGEKGAKLATYAARCIENEILMYFRNQKKAAQDVLINDPIDTDRDGNTLTLIDVIADEENLADNVDLKIKSEKLLEYIEDTLDDREKRIVHLRYGLEGGQELTQREVAALLGISRSYVSRIEKKSLEILRKRFDG
jgi:RNA polymerase sporulation-specific sigma factor